ncbi:hypothetical protein [Tessaracoccus palaemonis]|uniref:Lipoprotein n=1 Tax=Tessaracoccus palaemonis TaxID=2829499 RepID=A0ABX8SJC6_9ACTN|nr:hypothetical protein [Tessaracoccus palaemonis]QXT63461.1 hypothetical protein KDB89_02990 [Tessaracoccus palaemonis]
MKLIRVVPALAAVAMLAACSPMPSTALVAGDTTYSESQVDAIATGCAAELGSDAVPARYVVQYLAIGAVFDQVAQLTGTVPTDADLDEIATSGLGVAVADQDCVVLTRALAKSQLLSAVTDTAVVTEAVANTHIELNPMYGTWDPSGETILTDSGSLSVLVSATDEQ